MSWLHAANAVRSITIFYLHTTNAFFVVFYSCAKFQSANQCLHCRLQQAWRKFLRPKDVRTCIIIRNDTLRICLSFFRISEKFCSCKKLIVHFVLTLKDGRIEVKFLRGSDIWMRRDSVRLEPLQLPVACAKATY
jgi:hypothetical protein